jgi:hypothetical protein
VRLTEDQIDRRLIIGRRLERDDPSRDPLELPFGLLDEQRAELVF